MCVYTKDIHLKLYVADPSYMLYWCTCSTQEGRGVCTSVYMNVACQCLSFKQFLHYIISFPLLPSLYPDASLTVSNIYQATSTVDYGRLWYYLNVPRSVYHQVNDNPSYPKKREAIITYFLNIVPLASWATLAGRLHYYEDHVSLEAVRKYLHHTTG